MPTRPAETTATAPPAKPDSDASRQPDQSFASLQDAFESALRELENHMDGSNKPW